MPAFKPNQPWSHLHILPSAILVLVTVACADVSQDQGIARTNWRSPLILGELMAITVFYGLLAFNLVTFRKGRDPNWYYELHKKLRRLYGYWFFVMRIIFLSVMSSICLLYLISSIDGAHLSENAALGVFGSGAVFVAAAHIFCERSHLGTNAWTTID